MHRFLTKAGYKIIKMAVLDNREEAIVMCSIPDNPSTPYATYRMQECGTCLDAEYFDGYNKARDSFTRRSYRANH